ncbi:MAG: hypothetical protein GX601_04190 [Anaerolineales bacterium]|nr:hypothetical protein [Anaerolineales bacterium]
MEPDSQASTQTGMWGAGQAPVLAVTGCTCEYLVNPLGLDARQPRLSWRLVGGTPGQRQSAYRVLVASDPALLAQERADLWDSGKVASSQTALVAYAGSALASGQRCWWQVCVWDGQDRPSDWSPLAWWEMGLLDPGDWQAQWVTAPERGLKTARVSPLFRREFGLSKPVERARLYVCGQGVYEAYANGARVGDTVLDPLLSVFAQRMYYDTYDVTDLVREGPNALGFWLAPGWFGSTSLRGEQDPEVATGLRLTMDVPDYRCVLIAQLEVQHPDGTRTIVGSDGSWYTTPSPLEAVVDELVYYFAYSGESFDALAMPAGWAEPGFNDGAWQPVQPAPAPTARLEARPMQPNRIVETALPVAVQDLELERSELLKQLLALDASNWITAWGSWASLSGKWEHSIGRVLNSVSGELLGGRLYEFDRHYTGWLELKVNGQPGDEVVAFGLDRHRLSGQPDETVRLRFIHRPFNRAPVVFFGRGEMPRVTSVRALGFQADVPVTGRFACSDPALNRLHDVCNRTWASLLLNGMPLDSWQERFGTALMQTWETSFYALDVAAFYRKWLTDHRDQQRSDGYFPMSGAPIALDYPCPNTAKFAIVHAAWLMYLFYGDRQVLAENYESMRRWLAMAAPQEGAPRTWTPPADHGESESGYGDHGRPTARWYEEHTGDLFETLVAADMFDMGRQVAQALGHDDDARSYAAIYRQLIDKANRPDFFERATADYGSGDQGCQAVAVALDAAPEALRERAGQRLIAKVNEAEGHLATGFIGSFYLLKALTRLGQADVAYEVVANETPPSWAYLVRNGETLFREFWTSGMIPHPGLTSVGHWFYQGLGGIQPDPVRPGFQRTIVRPLAPKALSWAQTEYASIRGLIRSAWRREGNRFVLEVTAPANTTALVVLPGVDARVVSPVSAGCVRPVTMPDGAAAFEMESGTVVFESQMTDAE